MAVGLLSLGTQSLLANQSALSVTGQNISNVNTEGYTRQRANFLSREDLGGVEISSIDRMADAFLNRQIWADQATFSSYDTYEVYAKELDNLMASDVTSISKAMDDYFGALQAAVDDPVSLPNRELFIQQAQALEKRFNDLDGNLRRQQDIINGRLESTVLAVNTITANIAELNESIRIAEAGLGASSELYDQRDQKLEELSQYVSFQSIEKPNGEIDVFVANGEPLVVGQTVSTMKTITSPSDTSVLNVGLQINQSTSDITTFLSGGELGGYLEYRENLLNPTLDELGRIAIVFADTMNQQHQKGLDLDNNAGELLYTDINDGSVTGTRVKAQRDNITEAKGNVYINDPLSLQASGYELVIDGPNSFTLVRESDDARLSPSNMIAEMSAVDVDQDGEFFINTTTGQLTIQVDGFTVELSAQGGLGIGDRFLVQPVRNGADDFTTEISDARLLALASPLIGSADLANTGTGQIKVNITENDFEIQSIGEGLNTQVPPLNAALEVTAADTNTGVGSVSIDEITDMALIGNVQFPLSVAYDSANGTNLLTPYTVKDATGATLYSGAAAGGEIDLVAQGIKLAVDTVNLPADGDQFEIAHNPDNVTDAALSPPLQVNFLSALTTVENPDEQVIVPTKLEDSNGSTGGVAVTTMSDASKMAALNYPLTLTYVNGTGNYSITDSSGVPITDGPTTGTVAPGSTTLDFTATLGIEIVVDTTTLAADSTFTIEPADSNEVLFAPVLQATPETDPANAGTGAIATRVTDIAKADTIRFPLRVTFDSAGGTNLATPYVITDVDDNPIYSGDGNDGGAGPGTLIDLSSTLGIELDLSGVPVDLDSFEISPQVNSNAGNAELDLTITDQRLFGGVNFPINVVYDDTTDPGNPFYRVVDASEPGTVMFKGPVNGDGALDLTKTYGISIAVTGTPANGDSFLMQHDLNSSEVAYYELVDADGERVAGQYVPGETIELSGYEITISNNPGINDTFTVGFNIDGVSDNSNALLMSDLQFSRTIAGASFQDKYGQTVEKVGSKAAVASINAEAGKSVLDANIQMRASISGVNLDEEAARLVQFQQAYQASAQLIRAAQTVFDSLLQSI